MTEVYDFAAIGAGPAGESAAELAAFYGHRSVVIEKNRPGGTVTTTGGAPTKTLREAALYLTGFRDRNMYGLQMTTLPDVVSPTIRKRTRVVSGLLQRVTADNITKRIPKDILIVGGGPVGAEYATICHASGAHVTLVADRLMPTMDGEMSRRMDDLFRMWGLTVVLGATADTITRTAPRILDVVLSTGAKFQPDTFLFAAGRVANTHGLDLDAAGVKTDSLGRILVDEHFRCISPIGTDAPYNFA